MQGRRIYSPTEMIAGDYYKCTEEVTNEKDLWIICCPTGSRGTINNKIWTITEHEDGTITVNPSIQITNHIPEYSWHGYLRNGIWEEV